jgi:hypothetical protein
MTSASPAASGCVELNGFGLALRPDSLPSMTVASDSPWARLPLEGGWYPKVFSAQGTGTATAEICLRLSKPQWTFHRACRPAVLWRLGARSRGVNGENLPPDGRGP